VQRMRQQAWAAPALGAALLLGADALARGVAMPYELPVGAITALLGAPVFVYLLLRGQA
ncbi:MAG: iron chelate uptake ABC transporter family permease subunit, partial [Betaproteobacteria bacterium]|nr:iron chelate uptake ABC transporter family permease subunit [Betaproteobacteria bacterium]